MVPGGKCAVIVPVKRGLHWVEKNTWRRHELLKFNCWKKICFSSFLKILDISDLVNHFIHFFLWSSVLSQLSLFNWLETTHGTNFLHPQKWKEDADGKRTYLTPFVFEFSSPRMERSDVHSSYNSTELSYSHIFTQDAATAHFSFRTRAFSPKNVMDRWVTTEYKASGKREHQESQKHETIPLNFSVRIAEVHISLNALTHFWGQNSPRLLSVFGNENEEDFHLTIILPSYNDTVWLIRKTFDWLIWILHNLQKYTAEKLWMSFYERY